MSKKSTNQSGLLSPENYIRKKSRNLPIKECYINKEWRKTKFCTIVIVRQHTNGNVTFCLYMVDLGCLGVKESLYQFNLPEGIFENFLREGLSTKVDLMKISYKLAHNIIHAGIEYAEDYGFMPCKDFTSVTGYFLEEDTKAIPLMKIACGGKDGQPFYVNTGAESAWREKQILTQLDKTAGAGNYRFILKDDVHNEYTNENYEEDEEDEKEDEWVTQRNDEHETIKKEFEALSLEEKINLYRMLHEKEKENKIESVDMKASIQKFVLCNMLAFDLSSPEEIDEQINIFKVKFNREFINMDTLPNHLFTGVKNVEMAVVYKFLDTILAIYEKRKQKKAIEEFRILVGDAPISDYLDLYYIKHLRIKVDEDYVETVNHYYQKYPDYFLFKIEYYAQEWFRKKDGAIKYFEELLLEHKHDITKFEADRYFSAYAMFLFDELNIKLSTILGFEKFLYALDVLHHVSKYAVSALILFAKIKNVNELILHTSK